jgi:hypothetical protein
MVRGSPLIEMNTWYMYVVGFLLYSFGGAFIGGMIGIFVVDLLIYLLLFPFVRTIRHTPPLAIVRSGGTLGFSAKFEKGGGNLRLRFANPPYADIFLDANPDAFVS